MKTRRKMWKRKTRRGRGRARRQKAGLIESFRKKYDAGQEGLLSIGRGGTGVVYIDPEQPVNAFKVSVKEQTCRNWEAELSIYHTLMRTNIDEPLVRLLKLQDYQKSNGTCVLELTRVVNPIDPNAPYTIQAMIGSDDYAMSADQTGGRGYIMGPTLLIQTGVLQKHWFPIYAHQLGLVLGKLHYVIQNDGWDLEVYAGKEGDHTILYIGDFDLSEMMTKYESREIGRMAWALGALPFFPTPSQPDLYAKFSAAYLSVADSRGKRDIAEAVLKEYTS